MARLFVIPAGSDVGRCKHEACGKVIYWGRTAGGRPIPFDAEVPGGTAPTRQTDGLGMSHFETCTQAEHFRRAPALPAAHPQKQRRLPKAEQADLFGAPKRDG